MFPYEYNQAKIELAVLRKLIKKSKFGKAAIKDMLPEFVELFITAYGHAWCMDVASERRKMAKLTVGAIKEIYS